MRREPDGTITYFPLSDKSEVAVGWYLELPMNVGNLMAMVFRDSPAEPWKAVIRARHYRDDNNTIASKDDRKGWQVNSLAGEDIDKARQRLIQGVDKVFAIVAESTGGKIHRIDDHTSTDDFLDRLASQPWSHMTIEPRSVPPKPH